MKFAIRDDDTNFFTKPRELESAFGNIWNRCPISLAVVPFHACTRTGAIPRKYWTGSKSFPIDKNKELVKFLKQKIKEDKVEIMLHGYNHKDYDDGYEFISLSDPYNKIIEGKEYLEQIFDVKIKIFVPPHNSISKKGIKAVRKAGLNISGIPSVRFPHIAWFQEAFFEYIFNHVSPYPIFCGKNKELYSHYLAPSNINQVFNEFNFSKRMNGNFCLTTHYWEVIKESYKSLFHKFMKNTFSHSNSIKFNKLSELF